MSQKISGSVCLNHPNVPALAHCATCRKPVCADCVKSAEGIQCCSDVCLQNALASRVVVDDIMQRKQKSQFKALLRRLVLIIVLLALAALAWHYKEPLQNLFKQGKSKTEELSKDLGGQVKGAKDSYQKELDAKDAQRKAKQQKKYGL